MNKIKKIVKYFRYFKNPLVVLMFKRGFFPKGRKIKILPRLGPAFWVARSGDNWLLDKVLNGSEVEVSGEDFIIQDNIYLRQGTSDTFVYKEIFIDKSYENCVAALSKESTVIDLGAHIGMFSIYCAGRCQQVFAYEAHRKNFDLAKKNIVNLNISNVSLFNLAVWSKSDEIVYLDDTETAQTGEYAINRDGKMEVKTISLVDIFSFNNINFCDLLKIDIEGAEYEVLMSAPIDIFQKIKVIFFEYHQDLTNQKTVVDLEEFLKKIGFKIEKTEFNSLAGLIKAEK
ncbi:MAG: FkbM family methyltransferase [Patescibacteria group bacterium]|jgi:FkbM family methyltransferase